MLYIFLHKNEHFILVHRDETKRQGLRVMNSAPPLGVPPPYGGREGGRTGPPGAGGGLGGLGDVGGPQGADGRRGVQEISPAPARSGSLLIHIIYDR